MKRIPEDILKAKCAEALRLGTYSAEAFTARGASITVPDDGALVFTFKDGTERSLTWEHRSRRESWTDEMRAAAKAKTREGRNNA